MTKNKAKNRGIGTFLEYLDQKINGYYQNKKEYPTVIILGKEAEEKINKELTQETGLDLSWKENKLKNYKGIKIEIKEGIFIELKG